MTTNHIKAVLSSLRAMIVKMLPAYKFYLGSTTETTTTQIGHGVMSAEDGEPPYGEGYLTLDDDSFSGFVVGDIFTVSINGVSGEYTVRAPGADGIGITGGDGENGWLIGYEPRPSRLVYVVGGSYANATISISQTKTVTTKKYQTKKLDKSLLPDNVYIDINEALKTARSAMRTVNPVCTGYFSQNFDPFATTAAGENSHTEGYHSAGVGEASHAEGNTTVASGVASHAEGNSCQATGSYSHAEGNGADAVGYESHAEGWGTIATGRCSHVQGKMNKNDSDGKYAHIVGNGKSTLARSNAHTLDWDGVPWYKGRPQFGGTAQDNGAQTVVGNGDKEIILASSTSGSTKKFRITVDDTGTLSATEVPSA